MLLTLLSILLIVCYGFLSIRYIRHISRLPVPSKPHHEHAALGILLLLHAAAVLLPLAEGVQLSLGVGRMLAVMAWMVLVIYWTCRFFYQVAGLQLLLLPLAMLTLGTATLFPGQHIALNPSNPAFILHVLVSLLAYSFFMLGAFLAILMQFLETSLHSRRGSLLSQQLPPLLTLEHIMFRVIMVGFILLTGSLLSGVVFSEALFGKPISLNHKTVLSILAWCLFAALLLGRTLRGWRGKMAIRWTLAGFISLLLAYIGSKMVLEYILHRSL